VIAVTSSRGALRDKQEGRLVTMEHSKDEPADAGRDKSNGKSDEAQQEEEEEDDGTQLG
jgi:hypothetical protein